MSFALRHPASCLRHRREESELLDTYTHAHATAVYVRQTGGKAAERRKVGRTGKREGRKGKARGRKGRWRQGRDR
jgi:hypothetical protein